MQERVKYKTSWDRSLTPCPHGMMATCFNCKIKKPTLVHVAAWIEKDCPYYGGIDEKSHEVICNYDPNGIKEYNSR
jgi:hypothetical protein